MINLVEHLWQFEPKDIVILPTVIKIGKEDPKAYFYSLKQRRVLRKKEHGVATLIEVLLGDKKKKDAQFLFISQQVGGIESKQRIVTPSLILQGQIYEILNRDSHNCMIVALESDLKVEHLIECRLNLQKNQFSLAKMSEWRESDRLWSNDFSEVELQGSVAERLRKQTVRILQLLLLSMKIGEQCQIFEVLMACKANYSDPRIIWCNKLQWKSPNFYQIVNEMGSFQAPSVTFKSTPIQRDKISLLMKKQEAIGQFPPVVAQCQMRTLDQGQMSIEKKIQQQEKEGEICKGCEGWTVSAAVREVPNEEVVLLRRSKKLSIMGFSAEYYNICQECSDLLQILI